MTSQPLPSSAAPSPASSPEAPTQQAPVTSLHTPAQAAPLNFTSANPRSLAGAAFLVMVFFVLSRVTGLFREVAIGSQFGTSAEYDAYLAAFRMPDILFQLIAGGTLGSAFIPTFTQYWAKGGVDPSQDHARAAWQLFSRTINLVVLILVVLAALAALWAKPLVVWVIAPGFDPAQQELTASLLRVMLVSTVIFGASGLIMGALNALQHFLLPAIAPVLYNLAIIMGALLLGPRWGVYGLAIGAVSGAIVHLLVQIPGLWRLHARYTLEISVRDPGVGEVMRLMGPRVLGLAFVQLQFLVNTIVASHLPAGSISALNYAWLLMLLPLGIFAQAIGTVIFPTFATQVATGQQAVMATSFSWVLRLVIFLTLPAAVGLWVLDVPLVRMLFEHGKFDPHSTEMVAFTLHFFALGLLSHAIVEIGVRVFYALHDTWTPVVIGVIAMMMDITLSIILSVPLLQGGLALGTSIATTFEMLALLTLLNRRMKWLEVGVLAKSLGRDIVAAAVMVVVVWAGVRWIQGFTELETMVNTWLQALGGIALATVSYGVATLLLGSPEARWLVELVLRRKSG